MDTALFGLIGIVAISLIIIILLISRYRIASPDIALIISGTPFAVYLQDP